MGPDVITPTVNDTFPLSLIVHQHLRAPA